MGCCGEGCCEKGCCNGLGCCDKQHGSCTCGKNCCCKTGCLSGRCCQNDDCCGRCSGDTNCGNCSCCEADGKSAGSKYDENICCGSCGSCGNDGKCCGCCGDDEDKCCGCCCGGGGDEDSKRCGCCGGDNTLCSCCGKESSCCSCCSETCVGCCGVKSDTKRCCRCCDRCRDCGLCDRCCKACGCCDKCCTCCSFCCFARKKSEEQKNCEENCQKVSEENHAVIRDKPDSSDIQHIESIEVCMPPQYPVRRSKGDRCKDVCKRIVAFLFSTIGLSCLMIGYTIFGGFIFMELEAPNELRHIHNIQQVRRWHADKLWKLTEGLNVLHPENWTTLANEILENFTHVVHEATKRGWDGRDGETELQWTFASSMLYSITVVTTIGYGHIAPKTHWGRLVTIIYAILGIPLTLLTITNLGGFMASAFRFIYKNICCGLCCICCQTRPGRRGRVISTSARYHDRENVGEVSKSLTNPDDPDSIERQEKNQQGMNAGQFGGSVQVQWRSGLQRILKTEDNKTVRVPIYISLLVITVYIILGAVLFAVWEDDWDYLIGSYFCFITLTTIGFGDFVPGTTADSWANQEKLVLCALYLIIGLSLIAMCFDLMQEEARAKCKALGRKLGLLDKKKEFA